MKTREGREIVRPFFVSFFLLRRNSEINKFIPFEFGESREFVSRLTKRWTGQNFFIQKIFTTNYIFYDSKLRNFAAEFYANTMKKVKQFRGRGAVSLLEEKKFIGRFYKSPPAPSSPRLCNPRLEHVHKIYRIITISWKDLSIHEKIEKKQEMWF